MFKQKFLTLIISGLTTLCASAQNDNWGNIEHKGQPWVKNTSLPFEAKEGLQDRHISLWASHGRYYDQQKGYWRWQRPALFATCEDLFTPTIVVPYLIPMLERAGAYVFTPRERDLQRHEVIVDNDDHTALLSYREHAFKHSWKNTGRPGFAFHRGHYQDGENPFDEGTARIAKVTKIKSKHSMISYQPNLPAEGRYAVYVSYQTVDGSIDDAHYTVWHKGEKTEFEVNQQMGGSTWVYLGTFDFDRGSSEFNRVTLSNQSRHSKGYVTADAVRFGGGMGNIERGGEVSGMPRFLEGARYAAQWAGMPYSVYSSKDGQNDYADDINVRSLMTNYLAGGSCYVPNQVGLGVPIELSLAIHSDAGHTPTGEGVHGSLAICTTNFHDRLLAAGVSRQASFNLAGQLLNNAQRDLENTYGTWSIRHLWDRNYSETRLPEVPSSIFETLSHQNFGDMRFGQDPNFRFTLARSVYKTLLRFIHGMHDDADYTVAPLTPNNFRVEIDQRSGEAFLTWQPVNDPQEPSAKATGYLLYTATEQGAFDNGQPLNGSGCRLELEPNVLYSFYVEATNKGGRSFPTEVLSAYWHPKAKNTVLVVNGFKRVSSPAIMGQGFDLDEDLGITYGPTAGWLGRQQSFDVSKIGIEDSTGLGFSSQELAGRIIAGNDFNYVRTHADAIAAARDYTVVSCAKEALSQLPLKDYDLIDLVLGLERNDGHSLVSYKTFTPQMQTLLKQYVKRGGALLVSGAYLSSDMTAPAEQQFLADVLKCQYGGKSDDCNEQVRGLGTSFSFYHDLNEQHYAATRPDILQPIAPAFSIMAYSNDQCAAIGYGGQDYRAVAMGFPFECIQSTKTRRALMRGLLQYLIINH